MGKKLTGMERLKKYFLERPTEKIRVSEILKERRFKGVNEFTLRANIRNLLNRGFLSKKLKTKRIVFFYLNPHFKKGTNNV